MRDKIRSSLSFANVCSALALFIALSTGTAYAADTIFSSDIVNGEVKREDLAPNAVNGSKIVNGSVGSADLAPDSVAGANILDSSIGALDLGGDSVGTAEIATDGVQATEIADDSVDGGEIADGSLGGIEITDGSLGGIDIMSDSLTSSDLGASSVGSSELAANGVDGSKVASNSLTTADIEGVDVAGVISLGAGAVANGRCEDVPITVGGAVAGEAVLISVKGALPEGILIYGARVPSAGTVTMKVCNLSGATMAAVSNLPIRIITFG